MMSLWLAVAPLAMLLGRQIRQSPSAFPTHWQVGGLLLSLNCVFVLIPLRTTWPVDAKYKHGSVGLALTVLAFIQVKSDCIFLLASYILFILVKEGGYTTQNLLVLFFHDLFF